MTKLLARARTLMVALIVGGAMALGAVELLATPGPCQYNPPAGYLGTCKTDAECTDKCAADPYNNPPGLGACNDDGCCICA